MDSNIRYKDKPLLRLLELYVLNAIGELPPSEKQTLEKMTPRLQAMFGGDGPWHAAVASAVNMPADMPIAIQDKWAKNLEIARANGVILNPQDFAEMFVDQNLAL